MGAETVTIVWYGTERLKEIDARIKIGMEQACSVVEKEAQHSMIPGTGRLYGKHRASIPGMPPAVDTGRLRASITHEVESVTGDIIGRVGTNVKYSKWLEHGTSRMEPRPFLFPALEVSKSRIKDLLSQ
jgi:HK97 gp10 family phage protein